MTSMVPAYTSSTTANPRVSVSPASVPRRARPSRLLTNLPGLAVHRARRPLAGWAAGAMAYFLLIGMLATTMTDFLRDNPAFADLAAQAGFGQLGSVQGYVSALFTLLAVVLGAFAASRVTATAADETAGRLALSRWPMRSGRSPGRPSPPCTSSATTW